ncbi:hypothetical protein E2320_020324 [Naja naja]|nr:hypothetical protein E2320_020324 [Naja naja]
MASPACALAQPIIRQDDRLRAGRESGCDFECREKPERTMAEMKDDNDELAMLEKDIKEFWAKFKTICCLEPIDQVLGLRDSFYESINSLSDKWSKRLKEGDEIINKFYEYSNAKHKTEEAEERFQKAEKLFKERLGLEIRKTCDKHLQFVFRYIDHKDFQKPYILTLSINEEGAYEVVSCSPPLDCTEELQRKVRETNNFSAFIANVRKAFIALTYQ